MAKGKARSRYGSRQTKVYTASRDKVWVGLRQDRTRSARAWNLNTTPMRALNRRKLLDIKGMEKPGRSGKVGGRVEGSSVIIWGIEPDPEEEEGSEGMTCDMSLKVLVSMGLWEG